MNFTTIILSVSRPEHLAKMFATLELLECDRERVGLLVYVDGNAELYTKTRNYVVQSKFADQLCVQGHLEGQQRKYSINARRRRIAAVHNAIRPLLKPCEYVFLIEDDSVPPPNALKRLRLAYLAYPHAGFIEGVELGRWGIPHVGAWRADDVYEPSELVSAMPAEGVEPVDAGGLYCVLTRYEHYAGHEFQPYEGCAFGPDVEWGLWLRQQGYQNYIDWGLLVEHRRPDGTSVHPGATDAVQIRFERLHDAWIGRQA
jgi:hypothetical protein